MFTLKEIRKYLDDDAENAASAERQAQPVPRTYEKRRR